LLFYLKHCVLQYTTPLSEYGSSCAMETYSNGTQKKETNDQKSPVTNHVMYSSVTNFPSTNGDTILNIRTNPMQEMETAENLMFQQNGKCGGDSLKVNLKKLFGVTFFSLKIEFVINICKYDKTFLHLILAIWNISI